MKLQQFLFNCGKRFFASEATATGTGIRKLRLSFACPHQTIMKDQVVHQVNLASTEGDFGILAGHVPALLQLTPGLVEIFESPSSKKLFFVSGGFAIINPDSTLDLTAMEAVPVDHLDPKLVSEGLQDSLKRINSPNEDEKIEAQLQHEVYQSMNNAISKLKSTV